MFRIDWKHLSIRRRKAKIREDRAADASFAFGRADDRNCFRLKNCVERSWLRPHYIVRGVLYSSCRALRIHAPTIFGFTNSCKPFVIRSDGLSSNSLYLAERRSEARPMETSTGSAEARCPVISSM